MNTLQTLKDTLEYHHQTKQQFKPHRDMGSLIMESYHSGFFDGIHRTLQILGIDIKAVDSLTLDNEEQS